MDDKWIPWIGNRKLGHLGLIDVQMLEKVAEIMDRRKGEWNLKEIEGWLIEEEGKAIKEIPTCNGGGRDRRVWPYTKNGEYNVKSRYHKAKEEQSDELNGPSTFHWIGKKVWKMIWGINVSSKIKVFL